jgi:hypothetical protein
MSEIKSKYYTHISNLPVENYFKIQKEQDLTYLLRDKETKVTNKDLFKMAEIWSDLDYQFLDEFGISSDQQAKVILEQSILILEIEVALGNVTGNRNSLELLKASMLLSYPEKENKDFNYHTILASSCKFMGFWRDPKEQTVLDFYSNLHLMNEQVKADNSHGRKRD